MDDQSPEIQASSKDDQRYEAFVRLLLEHEPHVRAFLRGLLPTWQDVEEVTQEASLIAWRKFSDFEDGTSFGGWMLTIARFEALKYRRRVARTPLVFADDVWEMLVDEATTDTRDMQRQYLEVCLEKMNKEKRDLLLRVHESGMVMKDLARQSGKSEQAFYKVIQRLRVILFDCVAQAMTAEGT